MKKYLAKDLPKERRRNFQLGFGFNILILLISSDLPITAVGITVAMRGDWLFLLTLENQWKKSPSDAMEYSSRGSGNNAPNKLEAKTFYYVL